MVIYPKIAQKKPWNYWLIPPNQHILSKLIYFNSKESQISDKQLQAAGNYGAMSNTINWMSNTKIILLFVANPIFHSS